MKAVKSYQHKHIGGCTPAAGLLRARFILVDMDCDLISEDPGLP